MKTSAPIAAALVVLAVAAGALWWFTRPAVQTPGSQTLSAAEHARARQFLAQAPRDLRPCTEDALTAARTRCSHDGHLDVDGDGRADCWRERRNDDTTLTVWRGCRGEGVTFELRPEGTSLLVVPPVLATPVWLRWLADLIVGHDAVACSDPSIADCAAPGPEWEWTLASAQRYRANPGMHGTVAPRWQTGPHPSSGALIVPHVEAGWMARVRGPEEEPPPDSPAGARIIIDAGPEGRTQDLACAKLLVHAEPRGIIATDTAGRWTWLFRGLSDYGGFDAHELSCVDDLVIASTGSSFASLVVIDPRTGGWLFEPSTDGGAGAEMYPVPGGDRMWRRDEGTVVSIHDLHTWLAAPAARRRALVESAPQRPELVDPRLEDLAMIQGSRLHDDREHDELYGEEIAASALPPGGAGLTPRVTCGGWKISASPTAVLAERGTRARWVLVEQAHSWRRMTEVRCENNRIVVERPDGNNLLVAGAPAFVTQTITIDLAHGWWSYKHQPR